MPRNIAVIVGSTRNDSINRKLAKALVKLAPKDFEFEFVRIDDLPVFNQDHDQSPPDSVLRVKAQISKADAFLFVTPEHNRSMPAALKNVLDWLSRPYGKSLWPGKPAGLVGASLGAVGTAVAQAHLRNTLGGRCCGRGAHSPWSPALPSKKGSALEPKADIWIVVALLWSPMFHPPRRIW